ncbi:MAG: glycosyltransferase [Clostridiaceae bacterium]
MKRILIVMLSLYNGGAERSLVNLLNEFDCPEFQIDLLLFRKEGMHLPQVPASVRLLDASKTLGALYERRPNGKRLSSYPAYFVKIIASLISRLAEPKNKRNADAFRWKHFYRRVVEELPTPYDVAVSFDSGEMLYYIVDKVHAKRKITWVHTNYREYQLPTRYDRPYFAKLDQVVTISPKCKTALEEVFPEFIGKFLWLPNLISSRKIEHLSLAYKPEEFAACPGANILSVARLSFEKGIDIAVEAAAELKKRGIPFCWFIVGEGPEGVRLSQQIHSLGLEDDVVLLGTRENPYPYIRGCDVLVQPSRVEGKSLVTDEARILHKPIVCANYESAPDQIEHEVTGLIVPTTGEGISAGIVRLLEDDALREEIIANLKAKEQGNAEEIRRYYALFEGVTACTQG